MGLERSDPARRLGEERERLWARWAHYDMGLDDYAARRSRQTAVVIFEPRPDEETTPGS